MVDINIEDIKKIAKKAGEEILKYYNSDYNISYKGEGKASPLTDADLASDKIIKNELEKYGIPILSEESADDKKRLDSEYTWVIDPLDGTSDFVKKTGEFSVMIGLVKNNKSVSGVVYEPVTDRFYWAQKNKGSFSGDDNGINKLSVAGKNDFSEMTILLSRNHLLEAEVNLQKNLSITKNIKAGSAGLKMCRIASGEADIYINSSDRTSEWDTCAGSIILQEAGGKMTDMSGDDLTYNNDNPKHLNGFVVSNNTRHEDIINQLKSLKV